MAAGFFLKPIGRGHARSISLPARTHISTLKIEKALNKLRNLQVLSSPCKADTLCGAIFSLAELYKSVADLLKHPLIQQALARHHGSPWVDELLEDSVTFLDICGNARERVLLLSTSIRNLQSALRRKNNINNGSDENKVISDYATSLKNLKREMAKSLVSLKQIDSKKLEVQLMFKHSTDQHLIAVVRVLKEASFTSSLVYRSILGYFSATALQPKASKWSLVLKRVQNKGNCLNELEDVEASLKRKPGIVVIQSACMKLDWLGTTIERLEKELESLFRQLIHARVALLNILSLH